MPSIETKYTIHRLVELVEAHNHIFRDKQPERSIHHYLKAGFPEMAFDVYESFKLGEAQSVRDMLIESREIVRKSDGWDWVTPMYGEEYDLE